MALDHYVPQGYLRQFLSPALGGRQLFGIRKRDGLKFPCGTRDVCRIEEGNTNDFLIEPRMIEEFLRLVEPKYPIAISELRDRRISTEAIFVIAGLVASITSCAPAAIRLNTARTRQILNSTAKVLDRKGLIPPAPESLGGRSLTQLLDDGAVRMQVDEKFPQAVAIAGVLPKASVFGNADWELYRAIGRNAFLTSDFPVGVQWRGRLFSRVFPLAPDLALRITCDWSQRGIVDLEFNRNRTRLIDASKADVVEINDVIVKSAEESVFYRDDEAWVERFVEKRSHYRLENLGSELDDGSDITSLSTVRPMPRQG